MANLVIHLTKLEKFHLKEQLMYVFLGELIKFTVRNNISFCYRVGIKIIFANIFF